VPPYMLDGQVVSSTAIRTLLAAGAVRGVADLLGRPYSVMGDLEGDELVVDPLRTLPRSGLYQALLHQSDAAEEVPVQVLPALGHVHIDTPAPHPSGPATLDFLRRVG
jgi:hypothetical protein